MVAVQVVGMVPTQPCGVIAPRVPLLGPWTMTKVMGSPSASVALRVMAVGPLSSSTVALVFSATGGLFLGGTTSGVWPAPHGGRVRAPVAVVKQRLVAVSPGTRRYVPPAPQRELTGEVL